MGFGTAGERLEYIVGWGGRDHRAIGDAVAIHDLVQSVL